MQANRFMTIALVWVAATWAAHAAPLKVAKLQFAETKPHYSLEFSYPKTGLSAIDRSIESWARKLASDFAADANEFDSRGAVPWRAELTYEIPRNDGAVFAVAFTYYLNSGGAHPNSFSETFHFLLPDGYRAELAEIFTQRGIARISSISIARLKRDLAGPGYLPDMNWIKSGAGPNARNFRSFVLMPSELVITFDAYQVAAYAAGPQEVRIALSQVKDTMRADVRAPAASFDCALARSEIERAICGSRDLARLDRHLGEAYAAKLTMALDDTARASLRQAQREWLMLRDATCPAKGSNLVRCLMPVYERRLAALEADL